MFRTILVPLDGSPFAEHALPWALHLAGRAGASLELVRGHVLYALTQPAAAWAPFDPVAEADCKQEERAYLDAVARRLTDAAPVSITETLVDGLETEGILQRVRDGRADLVVMATHGRGPLGRFFLGSVADVLVRETSVPVLLVRPHGAGPDSGAAAEDVLVPLDGPPLAEQILGPAADLARLTGATVTLLRVVLPPPAYGMDLPPYAAAGAAADLALLEDLRHEAQAYLTRVADRLREDSYEVETRVAAHPHAATALLEEAVRTGCDLIALETHGRLGLPRLFLGSVADKVVRGAEVPVLLHRSLEGAS